MKRWLHAFFFGCFHEHTTFPMTKDGRTYVACLNCGCETPYDWNLMRVSQEANGR